MDDVVGLLMAAGGGSRMGRPKALVEDERGPWLTRAVDALRQGGCQEVLVVLGAAVAEPVRLLAETPGVAVVVAEDWRSGMAASLRAGLAAMTGWSATAGLVSLVDLPDVGPDVVRRILEQGPVTQDTLRRASYGGEPGHPVLVGRDHWVEIAGQVAGDAGARDYLDARQVELVECGDLASGRDRDEVDPTPGQPAGE